LHAAPERFQQSVIEARPYRAHRGQQARVLGAAREGPRAYSVPWSLWITVGPSGRSVSMAMLKAFVTSAAAGAAPMDQPTTRREYASSTTAQYTSPSRVGCSVMSVTHNRNGASRENGRPPRSVAVAFGADFRYRGRPEMPRMPAARISRSTA
jgi:hypothetical protein